MSAFDPGLSCDVSGADPLADNFEILTPPAGGTLGPVTTVSCTRGDGDLPSEAEWVTLYTPGATGFRSTRSPTGRTYTLLDGNGLSTTGTVTIVVNPLNDPPVADAQVVTTLEDTALPVTLSGSDPDVGDVLTFAIVSPPSNGTLSGTPPNVTYTPNLNFNGSDSFTFKVNDGQIDSNIATVALDVLPVNDPPEATDDSFTIDEGGTLVAPEPTGALSNDSDPDGDALTGDVLTPPAVGTLSWNTDGSFTYEPPDPEFNGTVFFTYTLLDGNGLSTTGTVTIVVNPLNDPPVADAQSVTTPEDTALPITLTGSDLDGDALSFAIVSPPSNGTLSGTAPNVTYTPNLNFNGSDSFTFKVNDGQIDSSIATVAIDVTPVNDLPVAADDSYTTVEGMTLTVAGPGVLGNDSDPEGASLTAVLVDPPASGTLTLGPDGSLVFVPAPGFSGTVTFTYTANDGSADSNVATVTITVTPSSPGVEGCSPGYWKNHADSWAATGYATSQVVQTVFNAAVLYPSLGFATLQQGLSFGGGSGAEGGARILLRAGIAALLNAAHPDVGYPRSSADVLAQVNAALASQSRNVMLALATSLDVDNNLGCPLGGSSDDDDSSDSGSDDSSDNGNSGGGNNGGGDDSSSDNGGDTKSGDDKSDDDSKGKKTVKKSSKDDDEKGKNAKNSKKNGKKNARGSDYTEGRYARLDDDDRWRRVSAAMTLARTGASEARRRVADYDHSKRT